MHALLLPSAVCFLILTRGLTYEDHLPTSKPTFKDEQQSAGVDPGNDSSQISTPLQFRLRVITAALVSRDAYRRG
jgi:hypothetical protein